MSENTTNFGFGRMVPGFDFLQNLAKGASQGLPAMPTLSNWVAPTLNVEEVEKRIAELKAVQFWLEQNSKALSATIQALEVQKMTLATLRGMNVSMNEMADALKVRVEDIAARASAPAPHAAAPAPARKPAAKKAPAAEPPSEGGNGQAAAAPVDPLQWWGALTQQFQEIAANAMKDVQKAAADAGAAGRQPAAGAAPPARKAAPRKSAARARAK